MEFIIQYWYVLLGLLCFIVSLIMNIACFCELPTMVQISNFKEWLKFAVCEAEKQLGSGTGELKLRTVYDLAVSNFEWVGRFMSFEKFSKLVDNSLVWMRDKLETNESLKNYIEGGRDE